MRLLPVCVSLSIAIGAAAGIAATPPDLLTLAGLAAALTAATLGYRGHRPDLVLGAALCGFACAAAAVGSHDERLAEAPPVVSVVSGPDEPVLIEGTLLDDAAAGSSGIAIRVAIRGAEGHVAEGPAQGALTVIGELGASRAAQWRRGRLVRVPARVRRPARYLDAGVPDHRLMLARRGLALVGTVKSGALVQVLAYGTWWEERAAEIRAHVREVLQRRIGTRDPVAAAIAIAILIGDRGGLAPALEDRLQAAGTYHVIAISGGNIAVLTALLLLSARALRLPAAAASLGAGLVLLAHMTLVGAGASVVRATTMAVAWLGLRSLDQRGRAVNVLAAAGGLMLALRPLSVIDPGFLLSVGATGAIVLLAHRLTPVLPRRHWNAAATLLAASLATEIVLLPLSAMLFNRVTIAGLVLNLAAVPLMAVVQVAGLGTLILDSLLDAPAQAAATAAGLAARAMIESARLVEWWPWLARRVPAPALWTGAAYAAGVVLMFAAPGIWWMRGRTRERLRRSSAALAGSMAVWILAAPFTWAWPWRADGMLRVVAADVGQGDATLIEWPDGRRWLVDAGGLSGGAAFDVGTRVVAPALWARGVGGLQALVLTHGDPDHIGGAPAVLADFGPRELWEGVAVPRHQGLARLRALAAAHGSRWVTARAGTRFMYGGVQVAVWHPPPPDWERQKVRNDDSIVLELRYHDVSVVLPGDIGAAVERDLAQTIPPAPLRVLKAPHHGSATSSSAVFLEALRPAIAVISCGRENRFGHPAPAVLARYAARGTTVFRTDQDGEIVLETDGHSIRVRSFGGRHAEVPDSRRTRDP